MLLIFVLSKAPLSLKMYNGMECNLPGYTFPVCLLVLVQSVLHFLIFSFVFIRFEVRLTFVPAFGIKTTLRSTYSCNLPIGKICYEHLSHPEKQNVQVRLKHFENDSIGPIPFCTDYFPLPQIRL